MNLKEARERAGMSITALAREAHVSSAAICRYEKGMRTPSVDIAKRIAEILSVPWYEIIDNKNAL